MIYTARYEEINALYFGTNHKRFSACGVFVVVNALADAIASICGDGDKQRVALKAVC